MWKILVCDDDEIFLQELKKDIIKVAGNEIRDIEFFNDKEQFEFYIADHPDEVNIVIMDIELEGANGIALAEQVLAQQPNSQIVFVSAYDNYFLDVYSVEHVYFLKKPVDPVHLRKAIRRAGERIRDLRVSSLMISNKEGIHRIPFNEILCFENDRRKIHVYTVKEKLTYYGKFEDLMVKLDKRFMRCHNSYIVNITKARELSDRKFYFETEKVVPISKTYYGEVREAFLEYLGNDLDKGGGTPIGL